MTDSLSPTEAEPLLDDVAVLLAPLVRWLIGRGVPLGGVVQTLKLVYLREAQHDLERRSRRVTDSALSVLTGVHRKEIRALLGDHRNGGPVPAPRLAPTPASMLFTRWITDPRYRDDAGVRRSLARHGTVPSFEALAREVSSDVHPRTLLEELQRLGLVRTEADVVHLLSDSFVPQPHDPQAVGVMAVNVADHLAVALSNLDCTEPDGRHLEQSVFADGLSEDSARHLGQVARQLWSTALETMVREAQHCLDADRARSAAAGDGEAAPSVRMRFGAYFHHEPTSPDRGVDRVPDGTPAQGAPDVHGT
jgi:hypothetical protein